MSFNKEICRRLLAIMLAAVITLALMPFMLDEAYAGEKGVITGLKQIEATEDSVTITWDCDGDFSYQFIIGEDKNNMPEFPSMEWTPISSDDPCYTFGELTAGVTYYVRMRTVDIEIINRYFEFTYGNPSKVLAVRPAKTIEPIVILDPPSFVYNGKARKPSVTVKDGDTVLSKSDYSVSYAKGRKNVGTYKVTVTMKGAYNGTAETTFDIVPKKTKITNITPGKKAFTAKWKKGKNITGYEIQYSTGKKFKKNTSASKIVKKAAKVSCRVTKLKAKKKYYVRIRTYKSVRGKKYYSDWSQPMTVKTKK